MTKPKVKYSQDVFFVSTTNDHDHSEQVANVRFPQGTVGQMQTLVSAISQYRTVNDFIRDACIHWMHYRNETMVQAVQITEHIDTITYMEIVLQLKQERLNLQTLVKTWKEECRDATDNHDWSLLRKLIRAGSQMQTGLTSETDLADVARTIESAMDRLSRSSNRD